MEPKWVSVKQAYEQPIGSLLKVRGWVRSRRDSKGVSFIELNDGSRFKSLQIVAEAGVVPEETLRLVATGTTTSCAIRSPRRMVNGSCPQLMRITCTSPR